MLSDIQREMFGDRGVLGMKAFISRSRAERALGRVRARLERSGVWDNGWHLDRVSRPAWPNAGLRLPGLKHASALQRLVTPEVRSVVSELLGGRDHVAVPEYPQLLFSLPNADVWEVPGSIWHVDFPRLPSGDLPGVQLFTFLDTVGPGGGGTLVVAGSHRFVNQGRRIRSKDVKKALKRKAFFAELMSPLRERTAASLMAGENVDGVDVQVIELCGEPGDVYLTDLRLLHTVAPNAATTPRIMLTQRFVLEECRDELFDPVPAKGAA